MYSILEGKQIADIDEWLDTRCSMEYINQPLAQDWARISKIQEELGEAINAFILYTGQNPRKQMRGSKEDMLNELADTVITGILAIQHFTKDRSETNTILSDKLEFIYDRFTKIS